MPRISIHVPSVYLDAMDQLVGEESLYPSRSELMRAALRNLLQTDQTMVERMIPSHADRYRASLDKVTHDTRLPHGDH